MSTSMLLRDSRARPDLFHWNGPISDARLRTWLRQQGIDRRIPGDLVELWRLTGGGDFLETETLLGPFADESLGDDVAGANQTLRQQGLSGQFLVFCRGASVGAIDLSSGDFVELESRTLRVRRRFRSLDDWYTSTVRAELGARYGLR